MSQPSSGDDYAHPYSSPLPSVQVSHDPNNDNDTEKLITSNRGHASYDIRQRRPAASLPLVTRSRTSLRILSFILAVAVIGLLASAVEQYSTTKHMREMGSRILRPDITSGLEI